MKTRPPVVEVKLCGHATLAGTFVPMGNGGVLATREQVREEFCLHRGV